MGQNNWRGDLDSKGFCHIDSIFSPIGLKKAENIIDNLIFDPAFKKSSNYKEQSLSAREAVSAQPEFLRPSIFFPELKRTDIFNTCKKIAEEYFCAKSYYLFDHAIYKMPFNQTVTPWHQDQAYLGAGIDIPSLHFWIPFQDTNDFNGAMRFIAGSHNSLLEHVPACENTPHVLRVRELLKKNISYSDMLTGSVSIHRNLTLHSAGENHSAAIRKAWIIHFGTKPIWFKHLLKLRIELMGF